jgi:hypothetical protein
LAWDLLIAPATPTYFLPALVLAPALVGIVALVR